MSQSRFLSAISAAVAVAALGPGCSDNTCGPGGAPTAGLVASGDALTLTYGQLTSGLNNDCPASGAPSGVISLTIDSTQTDGTGRLTLCVGRPDLLAQQAQALGHDVAGAEVRLIDVRGTAGGCSYTIDRGQPVTGNATSTGLCGNGGDPAGFALAIDGGASLTRTCGTTVDSIHVTLHGKVAVAATR